MDKSAVAIEGGQYFAGLEEGKRLAHQGRASSQSNLDSIYENGEDLKVFATTKLGSARVPQETLGVWLRLRASL